MKVTAITGHLHDAASVEIGRARYDSRDRNKIFWPISQFHLGVLVGLHKAGVDEIVVVFNRGEEWSYVVQVFSKDEYDDVQCQHFPMSDKFFIVNIRKPFITAIVQKWEAYPGNVSFMLPG